MMTIDSHFLQGHVAYSRWATFKLIDAARSLSEEQLRRDLGNSFGGVLATLTHIYAADRIWLSRLRGTPRFTLLDDGEEFTLDQLAAAWPQVNDGLAAYLDTAQVGGDLHWTNLQGKKAHLPVWQVLLHVVNHATYHRGQITTMIRQLGGAAVSTDLIYYYVERAKAAGADS